MCKGCCKRPRGPGRALLKCVEPLRSQEAGMKRHFSNRGEALPEVTAARVLARRKGSVKTCS